MTRGCLCCLTRCAFLTTQKGRGSGRLRKDPKVSVEPVLHFCLGHHEKKDSEEQVAGQMTWSAGWDPAKIAHLVSSDCCDECSDLCYMLPYCHIVLSCEGATISSCSYGSFILFRIKNIYRQKAKSSS